jgi:mRNA interferase MazF
MVKRGDIYWVNLDPTIGSETKKTRPAIVISNDIQNKLDMRYIVGPITSQVKKIYPFESAIFVDKQKAKVLLDQIRSIDRKRLGKFIRSATREEMLDIERALKLVLALS